MAATTTLLAQAEQAYHRLMTGTAVVEVRDSNGETIKYNANSATKLASYILLMKRELGLITEGTGPMKVWF